MATDPTSHRDRSDALRAMLVDRVRESRRPDGASSPAVDGRQAGMHRHPFAVTAALATVLVVGTLTAFAVFSSTAPTTPPAGAGSSSPSAAAPVASPTPGQVLAVFSNTTGGAKQSASIALNGLAFTISLTCTSGGSVFIHSPGNMMPGGPCIDGESFGTLTTAKGTPGHVTVGVTTTTTGKHFTWKVTFSAAKPTYVPITPVLTPPTVDGAVAAFCTSDDLSAAYRTVGPRVRTSGPLQGDSEGEIVFTNTSAQPCALAGQPVLQFVDSSGALVGRHSFGHTDQRDSTARGLRAVVLSPGGHAYVQTQYRPVDLKNSDGQACTATPFTTIRIDLANSLASAAQHGTLTATAPKLPACEQPTTLQIWSTLQLTTTVFVDYAVKG